jgi:hypothetical protein
MATLSKTGETGFLDSTHKGLCSKNENGQHALFIQALTAEFAHLVIPHTS